MIRSSAKVTQNDAVFALLIVFLEVVKTPRTTNTAALQFEHLLTLIRPIDLKSDSQNEDG